MLHRAEDILPFGDQSFDLVIRLAAPHNLKIFDRRPPALAFPESYLVRHFGAWVQETSSHSLIVGCTKGQQGIMV